MSNSLSPFAAQLVQVLGWGLLHSLWQGALIWLLLLVIFKLFPAMSSRLKHTCALAAFSLLLLWIGNTCFTQWQTAETSAVRVIPGGMAADGNAYFITTPITNPAIPGINAQLLQTQVWMPWLMLCYAIGVLIMLGRLGRGLMQLHYLRTRDIRQPEGRLLGILQRLQLQTGITTRVALRISFRVITPIVVGALRPLILLPASMLENLGSEGLEAILLHELAHISRSDYLINILLSVAECLLFFNPFVWGVCAAIRREREHCCDDFVLANTAQPVAYAFALADLARLQSTHASGLAPAATGNSRSPLLFNRIKRIMETKQSDTRTAPVILACSIAAIIIATSIVCFTPSLAQRSRKPKGETSQASASDSPDSRLSGAIIIDSNGHPHQYSSIDKMPPAERAALRQHLRELDDTMRNMGPRIAASLAGLGDSMNTTVAQAIAQVDWQKLNHTIDSAIKQIDAVDWQKIDHTIDIAIKQVDAIDWEAISRDIHHGLVEADRTLYDPKVKAEIRRATAMAKQEIEQSRQQMRREGHRMAEEARRGAEEARMGAEEARRKAEDMRRELEQLRREAPGIKQRPR
jgi:beta-lactamase regulating signal transducer with metallopeptidase domain